MTSTYFSRMDLTKLYATFRTKVELLQANCLARGVHYYGTSGLRTVDEQNSLYALGRTKKNVDATPAKPMGGVVTNARGGQSYHNFGIATDGALDKDTLRDGLQPDWNPEAYAVWGEEAAKVGLEWGGSWKSIRDYPNVQLPLYKHALALNMLQTWYAHGGLSNVFTNLDKYDWK